MRRRMIALLLPVLVLVAVGVLIFVGVLVSDRRTQAVYADRTGDAARFASMVGSAIDTGDTLRLRAEVDAYSELYSSPVWVLGLDRTLLHSSGAALPTTQEFALALEGAFGGDRAGQAQTVWPWSREPLRVLEPVGRDSQVSAVVVIEAPTDRLRQDTLWIWALGGAILLLPLGALVLGMWPVTRWILRPVRDLELAAATIRAGDLDVRVEAERGPTELRELAGAFNSMVDTVQRSLRRQREFVSDAAHQLRNPLASLQLTIESMEPWLREPEAQEAYQDAVEETERMTGMFEAMLTATSLTGAQPGPDSGARPVAELLAAGTPRWEEVLAGAGMQLHLGEVDPDLVLREPAGGLDGLIDELVANAARLSGGTGVWISVQPTPGPGPTAADLLVADDGVGLSAQELDSATGRFWRSGRHQNVPGTGLGLAILEEIVTDVGGTFGLAANDPSGLAVHIRLSTIRPTPDLDPDPGS